MDIFCYCSLLWLGSRIRFFVQSHTLVSSTGESIPNDKRYGKAGAGESVWRGFDMLDLVWEDVVLVIRIRL